MSTKVPTDGRKFAEYIGTLPKPRRNVGRELAERIGVKSKAIPADRGKRFAESIRDGK